jgi:hypothetical protein
MLVEIGCTCPNRAPEISKGTEKGVTYNTCLDCMSQTKGSKLHKVTDVLVQVVNDDDDGKPLLITEVLTCNVTYQTHCVSGTINNTQIFFPSEEQFGESHKANNKPHLLLSNRVTQTPDYCLIF